MIALLGINVKSLHADLNPNERSELVTDFQTNENGVQILLLNFMIGVSGLNMQRWCRNVLFFEGPPNVQIERQAIGRVRRIGQKRWVRVIRFLVEDSFSLRMNAMLLVKSLAGLMTELNADAFFESDSDIITLEKMTITNGELVTISSNPAFAELKPLSADQTLVCIQKLLRGERLEVDNATTAYYEKAVKL